MLAKASLEVYMSVCKKIIPNKKSFPIDAPFIMKILEELTKQKTHFSFARNREKGGKIENKVKLIATFLNDK